MSVKLNLDCLYFFINFRKALKDCCFLSKYFIAHSNTQVYTPDVICGSLQRRKPLLVFKRETVCFRFYRQVAIIDTAKL